MIKLEHVVLPSPEQMEFVIEGMRNPMNSWDKSDSNIDIDDYSLENIEFGPNDLSLMQKLSAAGTDHRKFMRMMPVMVRITAPLYWWKEFDTYKVGTVANSCSTMHKITEKEFTLDDFSHEHLIFDNDSNGEHTSIYDSLNLVTEMKSNVKETWINEDGTEDPEETECWVSTMTTEILPGNALLLMIDMLNNIRKAYLNYTIEPGEFEACDIKNKKDIWWQLIQLLPSSYNQTRNVMLNYEVLRNMYHARKNHKLDEWVVFCKWIETLPYAELITGDKETNVTEDERQTAENG